MFGPLKGEVSFIGMFHAVFSYHGFLSPPEVVITALSKEKRLLIFRLANASSP